MAGQTRGRAAGRQPRVATGVAGAPAAAAAAPTPAELRAVNEQLLLAGLREQEARAEAERLAAERDAILRQLVDGVVIADPAGRITFGNAAARRLNDPLALEPTLDAVARSDRVRTLDGRLRTYDEIPLVRALRGETVVGLEFRIRQPDGTETLVRNNAAPVRADDGSLLGAVVTIRDVTAEHALERQKDEFLASLSHDLQAPLTTIQTSVGVLLEHAAADLPEPLSRMLDHIERAGERMAALVAELLELARLQAGRVEPRQDRLDLGDLARRASDAMAPHAQERGQHMLLNVPADPVPFQGDEARLGRALLNLLDNACRYGRVGGVVRLALTVGPAEAVFAVADDGPGIPPAELEHVFERFYRRPAESAGEQPGSGLGLAIVRASAVLHGGRAWAESAPGAGATFFLALPRPAVAGASEAGPPR